MRFNKRGWILTLSLFCLGCWAWLADVSTGTPAATVAGDDTKATGISAATVASDDTKAAGISAAILASDDTKVSRGSADQDEVRCPYARKSVCDQAAGCNASPIGAAYLIVPRLAQLELRAQQTWSVTVRRCDEQGCSPIDVVASNVGLGYLSLSAADRGYLIKMARTDLDGGAGSFVEIATIGLTTLTYFGQCRV